MKKHHLWIVLPVALCLTSAVIVRLCMVAAANVRVVDRIEPNYTPPTPNRPPDAPEPPSDQPLRPVDPKLVAANSRFGVKLLKHLMSADRGHNVFISPASISLALSMTYNGAHGKTRDAMARTLGLNGMTLDQINSANAALLGSLSNPGGETTLEIANSLWAREGVKFNPDFIGAVRKSYSAEITALPFDSDAPGKINAWVSANTDGKIESIVDSIDEQAILLLVNAVYFYSEWDSAFSPSDTVEKPFTLSSGKRIQVPMMVQTIKSIPYCNAPGAQVACLPYLDGRFCMWIILPQQKTGRASLAHKLNARSIEKWVAAATDQRVAVYLPKFRIDCSIGSNLKDALAQMGMGVAFSPEEADFRRMCAVEPGDNAYIGEVVHKTYLDVDEQGTEAAAVTGVRANVCSLPAREPDPIIFNVDRPFLCLIRDNKTKTILFIGVVEDPR